MIKNKKIERKYLNKYIVLYKVIAITQRDIQIKEKRPWFKVIVDKFNDDPRIPSGAKALIENVEKKDKIESLLCLIINQTHTEGTLYQEINTQLDKIYGDIRNYLQEKGSDIKDSDAYKKDPDIELFKRDRRLIDFCRAMIPEVAHPFLITLISEDIKSDFYDACTVLVAMNLIIDDITDKLGWSALLHQLSQTHRQGHTYEQIYVDNEKRSSLCNKIYQAAKELWGVAMGIIKK